MGLNKIFLLQEMIKTENYTPEKKKYIFQNQHLFDSWLWN